MYDIVKEQCLREMPCYDIDCLKLTDAYPREIR